MGAGFAGAGVGKAGTPGIGVFVARAEDDGGVRRVPSALISGMTTGPRAMRSSPVCWLLARQSERNVAGPVDVADSGAKWLAEGDGPSRGSGGGERRDEIHVAGRDAVAGDEAVEDEGGPGVRLRLANWRFCSPTTGVLKVWWLETVVLTRMPPWVTEVSPAFAAPRRRLPGR